MWDDFAHVFDGTLSVEEEGDCEMVNGFDHRNVGMGRKDRLDNMNSFWNTLWLLGMVLVLTSCIQEREGRSVDYRKVSGETMGTEYHITYRDSLERGLRPGVDSLLEMINAEVSTYIDSSVISLFNRSEQGISLGTSMRYPHFEKNYGLSKEIHRATGGYFDPTVMPLVNYWGFGYSPRQAMEQVDTQAVDSLLQFVGMDHIIDTPSGDERARFLFKSNPPVELDFSGIAKGYGVDAVSEYLEQEGIRDYLVEIGGELRCAGQSASGGKWKIGINTPDPEASARSVNTVLHLDGGAVATSGNYRNFHEIDGRWYGHTISPFTGFPELNNVLSASVYATDCARADAYATAFMAMGRDKSISLAQNLKDIEILLIVSLPDGSSERLTTPGFDELLINNK